MNIKQITRYSIAAVAGIALAPSLVLQAPAPAHAANDTPDGWWELMGGGWVGWNDHANDNPSVDKDDFYVEDDHPDYKSYELRVYWRGKTYTEHAYSGDRKKINIGNVPNGEKVYWRACEWDEGKEIWCSDKHYFRE